MHWSRLFEQKFLLRQRLRTVLIALAGVWVLWTFVIGPASLARLWFVDRDCARLESEIADLSAQEAALRAEVEALQDPKNARALEWVARDEHAMVRDGEKLVRFYEVGGEVEEE